MVSLNMHFRHGRKHSIYPTAVNYRANIEALRAEGCTHVLVSTACGSLQENYHPGDIVVIDQFIDRWTYVSPANFIRFDIKWQQLCLYLGFQGVINHDSSSSYAWKTIKKGTLTTHKKHLRITFIGKTTFWLIKLTRFIKEKEVIKICHQSLK